MRIVVAISALVLTTGCLPTVIDIPAPAPAPACYNGDMSAPFPRRIIQITVGYRLGDPTNTYIDTVVSRCIKDAKPVRHDTCAFAIIRLENGRNSPSIPVFGVFQEGKFEQVVTGEAALPLCRSRVLNAPA